MCVLLAPSWATECKNLLWVSDRLYYSGETRYDIMRTWYEFCHGEPRCFHPWDPTQEAVNELAPGVLTSGIFTNEKTYRVTALAHSDDWKWASLEQTIDAHCNGHRCDQWIFCDRQLVTYAFPPTSRAYKRALLSIWRQIAEEHDWPFDPSDNRGWLGVPYVPYLFNHSKYAEAVMPRTWFSWIWS